MNRSVIEWIKSTPHEIKYLQKNADENLIYEAMVTSLEKSNTDTFIIIKKRFRKHLNFSMCMRTIELNFAMMKHIPVKFRTYELSHTYFNLSKEKCFDLKYVPKKFRTNEMYLKTLEYFPEYLHQIPNKLKTYELCVSTLKKSVSAVLDKIPKKFHNNNLYQTAICANGMYLKNMLNKYKTYELCNLAITQYYTSNPTYFYKSEYFKIDHNIFSNVPKIYKTKKLCKIAFEMNYHTYKFIPNKYRTFDMFFYCVKKDSSYIGLLKKKYLNFDVIKLLYDTNPDISKYFPNIILSNETLLKKLIDYDNKSLDLTPQYALSKKIKDYIMMVRTKK